MKVKIQQGPPLNVKDQYAYRRGWSLSTEEGMRECCANSSHHPPQYKQAVCLSHALNHSLLCVMLVGMGCLKRAGVENSWTHTQTTMSARITNIVTIDHAHTLCTTPWCNRLIQRGLSRVHRDQTVCMATPSHTFPLCLASPTPPPSPHPPTRTKCCSV